LTAFLDGVGHKKLRNLVKNVVYASLYNAGFKTVFQILRCNRHLPAEVRAALTLDFVKLAHSGFFGRFVEIPLYHQENYRKAQTDGYTEIPPLGRRRYF